MMFTFTIICFSFFFSSIYASPLLSRVVFDPHILNPNANTVWTVGQTAIVTWDTSNLPPDSQLTNPNGMVVLGYLTADSENLMLDSPLAQGFKLSAGQVSITVPSVPTRDDYIVVLFGDSGNASPQFVINGAAASSSAASSSAASNSAYSSSAASSSGWAANASIETPTTSTDGSNVAASPSIVTPGAISTPTTTAPSSASKSSPVTPAAATAASATPSSNAARKSHQLGPLMTFVLGSTVLFYVL